MAEGWAIPEGSPTGHYFGVCTVTAKSAVPKITSKTSATSKTTSLFSRSIRSTPQRHHHGDHHRHDYQPRVHVLTNPAHVRCPRFQE